MIISVLSRNRVESKDPEYRSQRFIEHMPLFDEHKPRTHRAGVLQREKMLMKKLSVLLEMADEAELAKALEEDFDIRKGDKRYEEILKIWRAEHPRGG